MNIAIVNDTAIAVEALRRAIVTVPNYHLLWVAHTGAEAVKRCASQRPDLILMDMNMPDLNGVEATRQIMQQSPCAILIVTASITGNTAKVFEAMGHGALDVVKTPTLGPENHQVIQPLLAKVATIARLIQSPQPKTLKTIQTPKSASSKGKPLPPLVVIGSSTGGPTALQTIFSQLPSTFKGAIIVVQHIDEQFAPGLVNWLNQTSGIPVDLARPGSQPQAGKVLVAATNDHLILRPNLTLRYTSEPQDYPYRPSVNVLFRSVAQYWSQPGVGIILTGMGRDGATGLGDLRAAGWHTIAESADSCVIFGMPRAAIEVKAAIQTMPVEAIASTLTRKLKVSP
ncbi:MAG: chemotaxis response regulator protein-glutamate methylesterase [Cyanobacteria bacterium P01_F01_bin.86]